jgi:DNA mismatch repair ATPase MutS
MAECLLLRIILGQIFVTPYLTHYKREEDTAMKSGKIDEELSRMNDIVESITPNALILFNESFAATNEREGSEIARQIVSALIEKHLKVFFVTHLFEFAYTTFTAKTAPMQFTFGPKGRMMPPELQTNRRRTTAN